ncbi:MAG TPA: hypothetical protein VLJ21_02500 [Candidatus Binatia bacterium]|nr:hypothetical protein [Candidatus Binatia bacterium]
MVALLTIGLLFVAGCATGQSYNPPSGPVGGGCGVGASVTPDADPCSDADVDASTNL